MSESKLLLLSSCAQHRQDKHGDDGYLFRDHGLRYDQRLRETDGWCMSDLVELGHMAELETALPSESVWMTARGAPPRASSMLGAEIAAAALLTNRPERVLRATDQLFAAQRLCLYERPRAEEWSARGALAQMVEDLEMQWRWCKTILGLRRCQLVASELDRLPGSPDNSTLRAPDDPSPAASRTFHKKPLPLNKLRDVEAKFKSLAPGLTRPQQYQAVRNSPEFDQYHLTDNVLREAAKVVWVPRGRPSNKQQHPLRP